MRSIGLTRASQLIHVTETLERMNISPERILEQAKLPMWHLCNPDDLIPTLDIYRLFDHAARSLGMRNFGLQVGMENSFASLGTFGELIASSPTPYHSFDRGCGLMHTHTSCAKLWMTELADEVCDEVWFCRGHFRGPVEGCRQMEQYVLMRLIEHVNIPSPSPWRPTKICMQTKFAPNNELRQALGDPAIRTGQNFTGIAVPRALLVQPLRPRAAALGEETAMAKMRLEHTAPAVTFVDNLLQLTGTLLKLGPPQVTTAADILGLSVRTLQRRLSMSGLNYSQIVARARYQAATRLLKEGDISITEVAMELSYSDAAHFTRAFKRWSGVTPREYRSLQVLH